MVKRATRRRASALGWLLCAAGLEAPAAAEQTTAEQIPAEHAEAKAEAPRQPDVPALPPASAKLAADSGAGSAAPGLLHTPVSTSVAGQALELGADFTHAELLRQAVLLYRSGASGYHEVPFRRSAEAYRASVPATAVAAGSLEYLIELELPGGERIAGFASRARPFAVQVQLARDDAQEKAALTRVAQRRSITRVSGEWVTFGKSEAAAPGSSSVDPATGQQLPAEAARARADDYYRLEASYAYRPLRLVNEFGVRLGLVRGSSPREASDSSTPDVGLNYAAPWLRLRMSDVAHVTGHLVTGVTEVDFSLGGGLQLTLGDPYGASLHTGFEHIEGFGSRFFTRLDILASERVRVSPIIEATDMPNARRYGVRLLSEVGWQVTPELGLALLGGYQSRSAVGGGVSLGATASLGF